LPQIKVKALKTSFDYLFHILFEEIFNVINNYYRVGPFLKIISDLEFCLIDTKIGRELEKS
jgi:hypothetical protein